jgi:hypothetical protein
MFFGIKASKGCISITGFAMINSFILALIKNPASERDKILQAIYQDGF